MNRFDALEKVLADVDELMRTAGDTESMSSKEVMELSAKFADASNTVQTKVHVLSQMQKKIEQTSIALVMMVVDRLAAE